jgi:hypothetical protein
MSIPFTDLSTDYVIFKVVRVEPDVSLTKQLMVFRTALNRIRLERPTRN